MSPHIKNGVIPETETVIRNYGRSLAVEQMITAKISGHNSGFISRPGMTLRLGSNGAYATTSPASKLPRGIYPPIRICFRQKP
jgi:hypothetical protein